MAVSNSTELTTAQHLTTALTVEKQMTWVLLDALTPPQLVSNLNVHS